MKQSLLYIFVGGFVLGVTLRSLLPASATNVLGDFFVPALFCIALSAAVGVYATFVHPRKRSGIFLTAIFLCALGIGIFRFDISDVHHGDPALDVFVGEHIRAEGIVIDEPDERETHTKLSIRLTSIESADRPLERTVLSKGQKVLVTVDPHPAFQYGDMVFLSGILQKPKVFESEDGKVFDYAAYLGSRDIFYQMFHPTIERVAEGGGSPLTRSLFSLKAAFLENISRVIPEPESALLGGLVVGAKRSLGEELEEDFRITGIIHIVVLSGYNVTIVANAIISFFSFLPRAAGLSLGALSIVFFAIMTGASATIVRASIMALIVLAAHATRRTYIITRALIIAGFAMVLHNPSIVLFDASFQLSFAATVGLIYITPLLERYALFIPERFGLRSVAVATIATQLFVLPMILYKMGTLSLVALPVNLLILMTVPLTMLIGFCAGATAFLSVFLSLPFAYAAYVLLAYQLAVVDFFASLPFAAVDISMFPLSAVILSYVFFAALLFCLSHAKKKTQGAQIEHV